MFDIVLNEKLIKKAKELGFDKMFFLDKNLIIKTDNLNELMKKISSFHSKGLPIIILGNNDEINRKVLEDKRSDLLLNPEETRKKDFTHQRNSGLNQVLCKFAEKNNAKIGINLSSLSRIKGKERALKLGRITQNIRLARKYKTKLLLASFAETENELFSKYQLRTLGEAFGMTPSQSIQSLKTAEEIFK